MELRLEGVVLRTYDYGKNSKVLTILTSERGRINAVARGCVSLKSPLHSVSEIFAYADFCIYSRGQNYYVNSADTRELFYSLRTDIEKLALAQYFADSAYYVSQEDMPETELMKLLVNSLYKLSKECDTVTVKAAFELKLCSVLGFAPDNLRCSVCGKAAAGNMSVLDGSLICNSCGDGGEDSVFMNESALSAVNHIITSPLSKIFSFRLSGEARTQLSEFAEKFTLDKTGYTGKTLSFYKSVISTEGIG